MVSLQAQEFSTHLSKLSNPTNDIPHSTSFNCLINQLPFYITIYLITNQPHAVLPVTSALFHKAGFFWQKYHFLKKYIYLLKYFQTSTLSIIPIRRCLWKNNFNSNKKVKKSTEVISSKNNFQLDKVSYICK